MVGFIGKDETKEDTEMMVSTKGRYALTVMTDIARNSDGGYVSLADIAERENLSSLV